MQYLVAPIDRPLELLSAGQFISDEGWVHSERIIDSCEVIIGLNGVAYIQQDTVRYEVRQGDVLLLLPYRAHKGYGPSPSGTSFYWMHFAGGSIQALDGEQNAAGGLLFPGYTPQPELNSSIAIPLAFRPGDNARMNIYCRQLLHISQSPSYTKYASDYLLTLLLIELTQQALACAGVQRRRNIDRIVAEIAEWIRINSYEEFSVAGMVEKYGLSYDYVARAFKRVTGVHIKQYSNSVKLERAKLLLVQTGKSVQEAAWLAGFRDEKYFMKLFRKTHSMTPSQYRSAFFRTHMNKK